MKKEKVAFILNILIVVFEIFAICWMASGISNGVYSSPGLSMFKYFTVDSNMLMGIASLVSLIEQYKVLKNKKEDTSKSSKILKLMGVVGVTLTMLVTAFFLAPTSPYGYFALFTYSNFFLHFLNPLLSIIVFLFFENTRELTLKHTFIGIIPMLIYSVYYVGAAIIHSEGGKVLQGYDWYGFFAYGLQSAFIVLPILILITYAISLSLWKINKNLEVSSSKKD